MVFIGVGGAIDGQVDPVLTAAEGQTVQVTLINGEGAQHDVVFPDQRSKDMLFSSLFASSKEVSLYKEQGIREKLLRLAKGGLKIRHKLGDEERVASRLPGNGLG